MYCKLINNVPHKLMMPIISERGLYFGNSEEVIINAGYKKLVCDAIPKEDGFYALPYWEDTENAVIQHWRLVAMQNTEEATQ